MQKNGALFRAYWQLVRPCVNHSWREQNVTLLAKTMGFTGDYLCDLVPPIDRRLTPEVAARQQRQQICSQNRLVLKKFDIRQRISGPQLENNCGRNMFLVL